MDEIEQDTTGFTPVFVIAEVRIDGKVVFKVGL